MVGGRAFAACTMILLAVMTFSGVVVTADDTGDPSLLTEFAPHGGDFDVDALGTIMDASPSLGCALLAALQESRQECLNVPAPEPCSPEGMFLTGFMAGLASTTSEVPTCQSPVLLEGLLAWLCGPQLLQAESSQTAAAEECGGGENEGCDESSDDCDASTEVCPVAETVVDTAYDLSTLGTAPNTRCQEPGDLMPEEIYCGPVEGDSPINTEGGLVEDVPDCTNEPPVDYCAIIHNLVTGAGAPSSPEGSNRITLPCGVILDVPDDPVGLLCGLVAGPDLARGSLECPPDVVSIVMGALAPVFACLDDGTLQEIETSYNLGGGGSSECIIPDCGSFTGAFTGVPEEFCGYPIPEIPGVCQVLAIVGEQPAFCTWNDPEDFPFQCEECEGTLGNVDEAIDGAVLPHVVPQLTDTKEALGGGRWSIGLADGTLSLLQPYNGTPGPIAAVGDLTLDFPDSGKIHQDAEVLEGKWRLDDQTPSREATGPWNSYTPACVAALAVTVILIPLTLGGAALVAAPLAIGICYSAFTEMDSGYIACGIEPWGVTWGPQVAISQLSGGVIDAGSDGPATSTTYFDANGNGTGSGDYIQVYNGEGYQTGKQACMKADETSREAARTAANEYGTTAGGGDASISAVVELPNLIPTTGPVYDLGNGLVFSPTQGIGVSCDENGCPTRIILSASQCGTVDVKGGTPIEVTYAFTGGGTDENGEPCLLELGVTVEGGPAPPGTQVPALTLSMQYEGAGQ